MISYDMQDFGGLEEYAVNLTAGLHALDWRVCFVSLGWVPPRNQYAVRLKGMDVPLVQAPAWISKSVSDWPTKERILGALMRLTNPLVVLLALGLSLKRRIQLREARQSAFHWLRGQIMTRWVGPDYRPQMGALLLDLWNLRWRPDILHIQGYSTSLLFVIEWAKKRNIPVVYEEHQTPDPQFNWWKGFETSINKADRVIAVSEKSAQGLREVCKVTQPIEVRNPLLPDPFHMGWRRETGQTTPGPIRVTTIARLYVTKGLMDLLETAAVVKKSHPDVIFSVYGDGELYGELIEKAGALGLDGKAIFRGAFHDREELHNIMAGTDIFFLPSILEGQPLAIIEAMAYGCSIVSTAVGGIPELITDGINGLLCPARDPKQMAAKLTRLIEDPALRISLRNAARETYERSVFRPEMVVAHLEHIYNAVLQEHRAGASRGARLGIS